MYDRNDTYLAGSWKGENIFNFFKLNNEPKQTGKVHFMIAIEKSLIIY